MFTKLLTVFDSSVNYRTYIKYDIVFSEVLAINMLTRKIENRMTRDPDSYVKEIKFLDGIILMETADDKNHKLTYFSDTECTILDYLPSITFAMTSGELISPNISSFLLYLLPSKRIMKIVKTGNTLTGTWISANMLNGNKYSLFGDKYIIVYSFTDSQLSAINVVNLENNETEEIKTKQYADVLHHTYDITSTYFYNPITRILVMYAWASKRLHISEVKNDIITKLHIFNPSLSVRMVNSMLGYVSFSNKSKDIIFVTDRKLTYYKYTENDYRNVCEEFTDNQIFDMFPTVFTDRIYVDSSNKTRIDIYRIDKQ